SPMDRWPVTEVQAMLAGIAEELDVVADDILADHLAEPESSLFHTVGAVAGARIAPRSFASSHVDYSGLTLEQAREALYRTVLEADAAREARRAQYRAAAGLASPLPKIPSSSACAAFV